MSRSRTPIESFGPLIFNTLIEGSRRQITLTYPYRDAVDFRMRIHKLRNRMREDSHPLYSVAAKTKVTITWDHTKIPTIKNTRNVAWPKDRDALVSVIIAPHDSKFEAELIKAGVQTQSTISEDLLKPTDGGPTTLENLLGDNWHFTHTSTKKDET